MYSEEQALAPFIKTKVEIEIYEELFDSWFKGYYRFVIGW